MAQDNASYIKNNLRVPLSSINYHMYWYKFEENEFIPPIRVALSGVVNWKPHEGYRRVSSSLEPCISLITSGKGRFEIHGKKHIYKPGQILVVPRGVANTEISDVNCSTVKQHLVFDGPLADITLQSLGLDKIGIVTLLRPNFFSKQLQKIYNLLKSQKPGSALILSSMLHMLLLEIASDSKQEPHESIQKAITYINKYLSDKISVNSIAQDVGMTRRTFTRSFTKSLGMSPAQYIENTRLSIGREHLRTSKNTIGQIANMVGFSDSAYFSARFKKFWFHSSRISKKMRLNRVQDI